MLLFERGLPAVLFWRDGICSAKQNVMRLLQRPWLAGWCTLEPPFDPGCSFLQGRRTALVYSTSWQRMSNLGSLWLVIPSMTNLPSSLPTGGTAG